MPLQSGTRLGGYEIASLLGAGGMGEVYRARDTRLGRDVAIKILSPRIAADRDAVLRFEREARALATLNHPNIAAIYDVIESSGQPALVLELVEGQTLADRIAATRPLSVDEALDYAKQIAEALDVAHEAGIVHRDLKPGNIKVTEDGRIKVLDFGLAKAIAAASGESSGADLANSPTITVHGTHQGAILGTAAYMSPEQARGKRLDKRTDIWAFGCVLFEMLTGKRAFDGETSSDVIAAIIERAPDLSLLPTATPAQVQRVIARCLEKDAKRRARDIADVRVELDAAAPSTPASSRQVFSRAPLLAAGALMIVAMTGLIAWLWRAPAVTPPAPIEFSFGPPPGHTLTPATPPALSPDGRHIAFVAVDERQVPAIWIRAIDRQELRRLDGTEGAANSLHWSPDSKALAFFTGRSFKRINIDGGPALTILAGQVSNLGASWGPDDTILMAPANRTSLVRIAASGGSPQQVTTLNTEKENSHRLPRWLPDAKHFLFTVRSDRPETLGIKVGAIDSAEVRPLINVASQGVYAESGWLLFMTPEEVLMAQRLDRSSWALQGTPQPVAAPVRYNGPSFTGSFDASDDGRVVAYVPASRGRSALMWFDRTGRLISTFGPEQSYRGVRVSPDGLSAAVELADERYGTREIWTIAAATNTLSRLTSNPATDWQPVFSPDGLSIAFASDRAGASTIFRVASNGAGGESTLYRDPEGGAFPRDWSRDGKHVLALIDAPSGEPRKLVLLPVDGGGARTVAAGNSLGGTARLSPEGDRIAIMSTETGAREIYVISIRDGRRLRVSTAGGSLPTWGRNGHELFYLNSRNDLVRVALSGEADLAPGKEEVLFKPCASVDRVYLAESSFNVSSDGMRFLIACDPPESAPSSITVVVNWQSKLR